MRLDILIIFVIVLSSLGFAVPPQFTEITDVPLIEIMVLQNDYYPYNEDIQLNFHLVNSTGFLLNSSQAECEMHIYDLKGNPIVEQDLDYTSTDFYINLTSDNVTLGQYTYFLNCNSSQGEAGVVSDSFYIRNNEPQESYDISLLSAILGLIGFTACVVFFFKHIQLKEHWFLKIMLQFIVLILGFVMLMSAYTGLNNTDMISMTDLGNIYVLIIWLFILLLIIYFIYYLVERSVKEWKK